MKVLRALYVTVTEVILIPVKIVALLGYLIWFTVDAIRYRFSKDDCKDILAGGLIAGFISGVEFNKKYIKYGSEWWRYEETES